MSSAGAPAETTAATSEDDVTIGTFSQSSKYMHVRVEKPAEGYLCRLSMVARVPLPPDELYELLVNPAECKRVFKSLKEVNHRRVLAEDAHGNRTVEVDQTGSWRFLMFRGSFTVRMIVEQRRADRSIHFRLARSGFMRHFDGTWTVQPFDNASLDRLVNRHNPTPLHRLQSGLRAFEHTLGLASQRQESLVQLEQSIAPAFAPPKAITKLLQRIAAKQITKIMGDLAEEADRINSGSSSSSEVAAAGASSSKAGRRRRRREDAALDPEQSESKSESKKQLAAHLSQLR